MSAYEKPSADMLGKSIHHPHLGSVNIPTDFHTSAALHDGSPYGAYAQTAYPPHFVFQSGSEAEHFHYMTGPPQQYEQRPVSTDARTRPDVTSYDPQEGNEGCTVHVYLQTVHDLLAPPALTISLLFGTKQVNSTIQLLNDSSDLAKQYVVVAQAPAFSHTGHHSFLVPLRLMIASNSGASASEAVFVGQFKYTGLVPQPSQQHQRKRKVSTDFDEINQPMPKKLSAQQLRLQDYNAENSQLNGASPYSPFLSTPTSSAMYQTGSHQTASPRPGHHYSASNASQASVAAPSPHTPAWSPTFTTVNKASHSPAPPMTPRARESATASPAKQANPPLMRTSTIQTSPGAVGSTAVLGQSFNPYSMYPLKAVLKLKGDLDSMAEGWNPDEFESRRRLVQFTRSQSGSTIHADFKPIAPEDRPPNSITISCIWWEEKNECFVTSVDTIFLLESLVAVRFTVEEKNRIRRNLEGFRPLTVSKSKQDSEEFFKVIMGFPNPKPRNIEKDVKVFPWKVLSVALKKIISKYSASYSSTASAILTPASSSYASTENSADHQSPPFMDILTTSASYPGTSSTYSPHIPQGRMSAPITTHPTSDLRLQMPQMAPGYAMPPQYNYQPMPQVSMAHSQAMSAPVSRMPSWDFTNYIDPSPTSVTTQSMQGMPIYTRSNPAVDTSHFVPTTYSMAPPTSGI